MSKKNNSHYLGQTACGRWKGQVFEERNSTLNKHFQLGPELFKCTDWFQPRSARLKREAVNKSSFALKLKENSAACNSNLFRFASTDLCLSVRLFVCIWHSQSLWPEKRWARRLCMFSSPILIWLTTFSWFWNPKTLLLTAIFLRCELRASPRTRIWWGTSPGKFSTVWLLFVPQDCWGRDASSGAQSSELSLTQARCQRYQAQVTTPFLLNLN